MINCNEVKKLINKYIDGELDESLRSSFDEHIEGCKDCKKEFEETLATVQLLNSISDSELPEGFEADLHEKLLDVKTQTEKSKIFIFNRGYVRVISGIAAGMLILVTAWGINGMQNVKNTSMSIKPPASSQFAEKTDEGILNKDTTNGSGNYSSQNHDKYTPLPGASKSSDDQDSGVASEGIICSNVAITIASSDFSGDYDKISDVAKDFSLTVNKDSDGDYLSVKMLKTDYYSFKSEIKTALGESNISEGTIIPQISFVGELANNRDYLIVNMNLKK